MAQLEIKKAVIACLTLGVLLAFTRVPVWAVDPGQEPVPELDADLRDRQTKAVIVRLDFDGRDQVSLRSAKVVYEQPHVRIGDPPLLHIRLLDDGGQVLEEFNAWHPLWSFVWEDGRERRIILQRASGRFVLPFFPFLKTMEVTDVALGRSVISVDLEPTIRDFCRRNSGDPDCPPEPDRFEIGGGNDSPARAVLLDDWDHRHFDERVLADGPTPVRTSQEIWTMRISNLNLHSGTDGDFFRIRIPNPSDPADGGHRVIEECSVVTRIDLMGSLINVLMGGILTIRVIGVHPPSLGGESIGLYPDGVSCDDNLSSGGPLQKLIYCPRSDHNLSELVFSFGERSDRRNAPVTYEIELEYKVDITREIPEWVYDQAEGVGGVVSGAPCPGGFFPHCVPDPSTGRAGFEVAHPLGTFTCPVAVCDPPPDFFVFRWPATSDFDVKFTSTADLKFELFNAAGTRIGEALAREAAPRMTPGVSLLHVLLAMIFSWAAQADDIEKQLFIPQLEPGLYVLIVSGPQAIYAVDYLPPPEVQIGPPGPLRVEAVFAFPNPMSNRSTNQFVVQGEGIQNIRVEIYDLAGRRVFDSGEIPESRFAWNLEDDRGRVIANGVYLYIITVRGFNGEAVRSQVKKVIVLR